MLNQDEQLFLIVTFATQIFYLNWGQDTFPFFNPHTTIALCNPPSLRLTIYTNTIS